MASSAPRPASKPSIPPFPGGEVVAGRFVVNGILGEGGTGIVYDATRLEDGLEVALKVIHAHLAGDKQVRGRFAREAAILARLSGENLCPVLESGETDDPRREGLTLLYLALAKLDGPALDQLVAREGVLPIERAVEIMREVCAALTIAHAQGIVHRDLKPANVILEKRIRAVVVDFGMAKIVADGKAGAKQLTQHNMIFGTPEYMAPEQARGDELDERCDVYAAGVMLYELLTGTVPFAGPSPLAVLTAHMTEEPRAPRMRAPERGISRALEAIVMHALAKDPGLRYASAGKLATALARAVVAPDDVAGVAPDGFTPPPPPIDTPVDSIAVAAGAAAAAELRSSSPPSLVNAAFARAEAQARRRWHVVLVLAAMIGVGVGIWLALRVR